MFRRRDPGSTPTPSLSSASSTRSYSREQMLDLASSTPTLKPPTPASAKIDTVNLILRKDSADFERQYGSPVASVERAFMKPAQRSRTLPLGPSLVMGKTMSDIELGEERLKDGTGKVPTTAPMPMLLDFAQSPIDIDDEDIDIDIELHSAKYPGPRRPDTAKAASRTPSSASSVFNNPPGQFTASPLSAEMAWSLSKQHVDLRAKNEDVNAARSRSSSTSSTATITGIASPDDIDWRRPKVTAGLSAFAPPWPLPTTTPQLTKAKAIPKSVPAPTPPPIARAESTTLPPPATLPAKPQGSLPPIFVKREAALLPQRMALPHVAPMGRNWDGENSLSGNDRRRRASEQSPSISRAMSNVSLRSASSGTGSLSGSRRPEKFVRLGERLKETASRPIM